MWFWNVGGFDGAEADVLDFLSRERVDALVLIDSQLTDKERVKRGLPGWKMLHESRPHDVHKRRLFGGVTVLWKSENVRVVREGGFPKGVLSFAVEDAAGTRAPVAVIALYSPPLSSRLNRFGKHWSQDILDYAELEVARLWQKYGFVAVGGDFNWRLGTTFRRATDDVVTSVSGARTALARQWHLRTGLRPLYGQPGQHRGVCTSRNDNGEAEPDGVSVCKDVPPGWSATALPPPPWEEYSSGWGVHRPVGCAVVSPQRGPPNGGPDAEQHPSASRKRPPRMVPPAYGSLAFHAMSDKLLAHLTSTAASLEAGTTSTAQAFVALADGIVAIQQEFYAPDSAASPVRATAKVRPRTDAVRMLRLRDRNPSTRFRRLASGMRVPEVVSRELDRRRKLVSATLEERSQLKRNQESGLLSDDAFAAADADIKRKLAEANAIRASTKRQLDAAARDHYSAEADRLAHLMHRNPRRFFRALRTKLPQPFETYDESAGPSDELAKLFRDYFASLLENRGGVAGFSDKYVGSVPATDPATAPMLHARVQWQEVYAALYPAHRKARRAGPCLPGCILCPLFADHVEAFDPGNTHMTPPEHRPRLWTSKSAGPDGVFAETLRWACPAAHAARHDYRRQVCVALSSIFSKVIESGEVPECPQFADSAMTALFKGDGDRRNPSDYRGICVPNVLAKLFGLVLGTRLSHWAVTNGVISPAQTGFIVMHGCEYHIFTLLEVLRQRVRRGRDTFLVFLDFRKAYDSVPQAVLWDVLARMGVPDAFLGLLRSWTSQSRITMRMGKSVLEPFPQGVGVPQGGVLSPILFNLFIEVLLRYVNARAAQFGVEISTEHATSDDGVIPPPLRLLALAYADDVVLICPTREAAQQALNLVQEWASDFGMTIGVGKGKTEAMLVSADVVKSACANDVNGMPKKRAVPAPAAEDCDPAPRDDDPDNDSLQGLDYEDDEWLPPGDPATIEVPSSASRQPLREGQTLVNGVLRGAGTGKPRAYTPRPLPPLPDLPQLTIQPSGDGDPTPIPWTSIYKYLGFMLRADLLDDHAYERVERKTKATAERLFPHHRLVKAWPLGLKLQLYQSLVLSATTNVVPLLTSMRCASESKTSRLDQLRKRFARYILRLDASARHAYVVAEAGLGDVTGDITQHRIRFCESLLKHPFRGLQEPPIACRVYDISCAETMGFKRGQHSLLLAPWAAVTDRMVLPTLKEFERAGGDYPLRRWDVAPYASAVARIGVQQRWISKLNQGIQWACQSFSMRPPTSAKRQTPALLWSTRISNTDTGLIPKLAPLSCPGPLGTSIVALSRVQSALTFLVSKARLGNLAMQQYPFVRASLSEATDQRGPAGRSRSEAIALRCRSAKKCRLCANSEAAPAYDLWHVLFECPQTSQTPEVTGVRQSCREFIPQLCDAVESAVDFNASSLSDTRNAGVQHGDILDAVNAVRQAATGYDWDCTPGQWLIYTLLLALPFPAKVVRPDAADPVWKRKLRQGRQLDLRGAPDPAEVPVLSDSQCVLPEAMGRLFDCTVLARDALRPLADLWCRHAKACLLRIGGVVRPLVGRAEATQRTAALSGASGGSLRSPASARHSVDEDGHPVASESSLSSMSDVSSVRS